MDLVATPSDVIGLYRLSPTSIFGTLWLQTHFPESEWDLLIANQASFGLDCLSLFLMMRSAGLAVQSEAVTLPENADSEQIRAIYKYCKQTYHIHNIKSIPHSQIKPLSNLEIKIINFRCSHSKPKQFNLISNYQQINLPKHNR